METKKIWINTHTIHSYEVDVATNVTIPVLCKYMQEAAWHHAENLNVGFTRLIKRKLMWVLSNFIIKIEKLPKWGEKIFVHTWPSGKGKVSYWRDFKILNQQNEELVVASTKWYALDIIERRPKNIDELFVYDLSDVERVFDSDYEKIAPIESETIIKTFKVGYHDIDANAHLNNVKYIEWILESFSLDFYKKQQLKSIEINYLAEAFYDDELKLYCEESEKLTYHHKLTNKKEICRAITKWEPAK